ncbi:MAG: hypothetical protein IH587_04945 [Anaerolineae bacterium]|nr:hypothetical protein [Anaerolineae bacterium]
MSDMPDLDVLLRSDPVTAPMRAVKSGTHTVALDGGEAIEAVEVLTVMRDVTGGGLIVQLGDTTRRATKEVDDSEFHQKMTAILEELAGTGSVPSSVTPADAHEPQSDPTPRPPIVEPASEMAGTKPEQAPAKRPHNEVTPRLTSAPSARSAAFDLPAYTLDTPTPTTRRDLKRAIEQPVPELDIAGRIEAFLQHKLSTVDAFAGRKLHVLPAEDGIRIQVDETYYSAVDEVQDFEVRAFLQATIQEWQDRQ